ncbi:MAG: hypothetical protein AAFN81_15350 [Bacteroidota bacterium]
MNFFVQLSKFFGALVAIVLCVGYLSSGDKASFLHAENPETSTMSAAGMLSGEPGTVVSLDANDSPSEMVFRPGTGATAESLRPATNERADRRSSASANRRAVTAYEIEEWVQTNAAQSYLEAERGTISPGVILATGIYFLEQGQADARMNAAEVAAYLTEIRDQASSRAKAHMKYIANSEQWIEGLSMAGFDGQQIAQVFKHYQLRAYDKEMYSRHVERRIEQPERAAEVTSLALDRNERNRDLAEAYNDYADREDVRTKYALPTIKKPAALAVEEVSAGRQEAESFAKGESRTYSEPRHFWSVLKEVIALEKGYESWDAYHADHPKSADRAFQRRSDIMANGGVMKVTRR